MKNIAIIPARAGSKRLPNKNIKLLGGRPLLAWTIESALASNVFDRVIISTDSEEIAQIAVEYGASAPYIRPRKLATDTSTSIDVMIHCINFCEKLYSERYESITLLQPTSPFRSFKNIIEAFELYHKKDARSVVSVCEVEHPSAWSNKLLSDMSMNNFYGSTKRGQDHDKEYRLNGAIYIINAKFLRENKLTISENESYAYVMPIDCSIDIDTEFQFQLCKGLLATNYFGNKK